MYVSNLLVENRQEDKFQVILRRYTYLFLKIDCYQQSPFRLRELYSPHRKPPEKAPIHVLTHMTTHMLRKHQEIFYAYVMNHRK